MRHAYHTASSDCVEEMPLTLSGWCRAVYEGVHKITGERVAIKIIQHKAARAGSHDQQIILNEIKILRKVQ